MMSTQKHRHDKKASYSRQGVPGLGFLPPVGTVVTLPSESWLEVPSTSQSFASISSPFWGGVLDDPTGKRSLFAKVGKFLLIVFFDDFWRLLSLGC